MAHKGIQRIVKLQADAEGNPPSSIHVMSTGHWHAPWHGNFEMTSADLAEMVVHFEEGVGSVEGSKKLPINYGHDISGKAAGWITKLHLENGGSELWADVEWTKSGLRMLADEEFKYISPEWNPRSFPYQDPEDEDLWLNNVFTGAGLTNIPLFKKLKPVMASRVSGSSDKSKKPEGGDMTLKLEEVRVKKLEDLSAEEKTFLEEHKSELTDEQRSAFGFVDEEADAKAKAEAEAKEKADPEAAAKAEEEKGKQASSGVHGLTAAQITQLQADAAAGRAAQQELLKSRLTASVKEAVSRGAIKSDELGSTVEMLMASSEDSRDKQLDFISKLPSNALLSKEIGHTGVEASVEVSTEEKSLAGSFGNTPEEIAEFKKKQAESN